MADDNLSTNQEAQAEPQLESGFPCWMYGPNGEAQIFERSEDIPEGWADSPSTAEKNEEKKDKNLQGEIEESLSLEDIKKNLEAKSMNELYNIAGELEIEKSGKKVDLINLIAQKLFAVPESKESQ